MLLSRYAILLNVTMLKNFSAELVTEPRAHTWLLFAGVSFEHHLVSSMWCSGVLQAFATCSPAARPPIFTMCRKKRDIQFHYCTNTKLEETCARMGCAPELRLSTMSSQPQRPAHHWSRKQISPCVRFRTTESRFKIVHLVVALTSCCNNIECTNAQNRMCKYKIQWCS